LFALGEAWYEKDGVRYLVSVDEDQPRPCRAGDIGLLLDVTSESPEIQYLHEADIRKELQKGYQANTALSFALDGLDSTLKESTREVVIKRANKLCENAYVHQFVQSRLLARPVPDEFDVYKALEIAEHEKYTKLEQIYLDLLLKGKSIFMDFAQADEQAAKQLKQQLEQHDLKVFSLSREKPFDPTERFNKLEESLKSCDVVFLFYVNNIPASWVGTRLKHYQVIQVKRSRDNPMKIIVIGSETHPTPPINMTLPKNTQWLKNLSVEGLNK